MNNERLGNILLKQGVLDSQQLDFVLSVQKNNGHQKLGKLLCHYDFVNEKAVARALALQVGWSTFEGNYAADQEMIDLFGIDFFLKRMIFPAARQEGRIFVLARTDDTAATDIINQKLGFQAVYCIGIESQLRKALESLVQQDRDMVRQSINKNTQDGLNQWLDHCLNQALALRASDIHIEPSQKVVEVRFRIDGILVFIETLSLEFLPRLVNVIFHKSEVTISDFGHFHDSKFLHKYLNREVDVRVSHLPCIWGSAIVLRLLDKGRAAMTLSELGYGPQTWELIEKSLSRPEGINLIVGPTGCGKTTTLYAILNYLKSIDRKILTIEDPVEIQLPLMTQVQVNEKRGISFSQAIRSFLRHDPDVLLIGEIRDPLTAQEALRAAMTGHQIFSTLHINKALDVFFRLHDLGLPFEYMAEHISMVISQRLVRKLCCLCKKRAEDSKNKFFSAVGCAACRGGYLGQTVIAEVLSMDEDMGDLICKKDFAGLRKLLRDRHYLTMFDDAKRLIDQGLTSPQEIQRILGGGVCSGIA